MEAELLRYLVKSGGRVVSRKALLEDVWGLHEDTDTRAIDNFVVRLRRYIEEDPARPSICKRCAELATDLWPSPSRMVGGRQSLVDRVCASPPWIPKRLTTNDGSVLLRRRTRGQLTEQAKQCARRLLVAKAVQCNGGGEVRRGGMETNADEILVAATGERVDHGSQFGWPRFLRGKNDRPRAHDHPGSILFLLRAVWPDQR